MTLTNFALGKWKRIECDLEAFFFSNFFYICCCTQYGAGEAGYYFLFFLFCSDTLVTNSLSQLLLRFQQHVSLLLLIHSYMYLFYFIFLHTCLVTHTPSQVLDTKSETLFTQAL